MQHRHNVLGQVRISVRIDFPVLNDPKVFFEVCLRNNTSCHTPEGKWSQLFLTEGGEELPLLRIISEKDNAPVCDEREDWILKESIRVCIEM